MLIAGVCKSPHDLPAMTYDSLKAMADLLGPHRPILRTGGSLHKLFPTTTTTDFDATDDLVEKAVRAGWRILIDPAYPPAWVTDGKGAYVGAVEASGCQFLVNHGVAVSRVAEVYAAVAAVRESGSNEMGRAACNVLIGASGATAPGLEVSPSPPSIEAARWLAGEIVKLYLVEESTAQAWDTPATPDPSHVHTWGDPNFAEADKLSAQRPWMLSAAAMPHVDRQALQYMGLTLGERYGDVADIFGVSINEPDVPTFNQLIRFDGVNGGDGGDTIRDRLIPEQVAPYIGGLRDAFAWNSILSAVTRSPQILGPNVAYPGTLPRFERVDLDVVGGHLYGDRARWPASSYEHAKEYARQMASKRLPWGCSEIDGDGMTAWLRGLLDLGLTGITAPHFVVFNVGERFIDGWGEGGTEANDEGRAMSALLQQANSRRRAAGK